MSCAKNGKVEVCQESFLIQFLKQKAVKSLRKLPNTRVLILKNLTTLSFLKL